MNIETFEKAQAIATRIGNLKETLKKLREMKSYLSKNGEVAFPLELTVHRVTTAEMVDVQTSLEILDFTMNIMQERLNKAESELEAL